MLVRIILGWWFYLTNQKNELAQRRLKICTDCSSRKGMTCNLCGCNLNAKARVEEDECPLDKWPNEKMNKWTFTP